MKFKRTKVDGIMGTQVEFQCTQEEPGWDPFRIVACGDGVYFTGRSPKLVTHDDLQSLAKAVGEAMADYVSLMKCKLHVPPTAS